jgi:hypothetical protein
METENIRQKTEVADIFSQFGLQYLETHRLCQDQVKAAHDIMNCRTALLGGHLQQCDQCAHQRPAYNSCRNRHCPKCQYIKQIQWVDKLKSILPPTRYFHLVFTIPSSLHKIFYINQRVCYDLLFKAAATTLKKAGANPAFLGAHTGAVAILHIPPCGTGYGGKHSLIIPISI